MLDFQKNIQQCINCIHSITDEWSSGDSASNFTSFMIGEINARLHIMLDMVVEELSE